MQITSTGPDKHKPKARKVRITDYYKNLLSEDEDDLLPVLKPKESEANKPINFPTSEAPKAQEGLPESREDPRPLATTPNEFEVMAAKALQKQRELEQKRERESEIKHDTMLREAAEARGMSFDDLQELLKKEVEKRVREQKKKDEIEELEDGGMPVGGFEYHPYLDKTQYTLIPNQLFPLLFKEKYALGKIVLKIFQMTLGFKMKGEDKATRREYVKLRHHDFEVGLRISNRDVKPAIQEAITKGYIGRKEIGNTFAYWIKFKGKPDPIIFDEKQKVSTP